MLLPKGRRRLSIVLKFTLVICVYAGLLSAGVAFGDKSESSRSARVVVIHSYHYGFTWSDSISQGIREVFAKEAMESEVKFEFLDTRFNASETYLNAIGKALETKYASRRIDVIIASDDHALNFMLTTGHRIFSDVPVVFCSVSGFRPEMRNAIELTGLRESIAIRPTVETALRLHPETQEIAVLLDQSRTGQALKRKTEEALRDLPASVGITYLEEWTVAELQERLPKLSPNTIVLVFIFRPDETGRVLTHEQNLARLRPSCPFPMYAVWQFYLGHGIVGGQLSNGNEEGQMAARMALRIINGENASDIPLGASPVKYMFDYNELKRFAVDKSSLPPDSMLVNEPHSFYATYKTLIWNTVVLFGFLLLALLGVSFGLINARKAKERYRRIFENSVIGIFESTPDGRLIRVNPAFAKMLRYDSPEDLMAHVTDVTTQYYVNPDDRSRYKEILRQAGEVDNFEHKAKCKDGTEIWVSSSTRAFFNKDGKVYRYEGATNDITDRRLAEQEKEKLEAQLVHAQKMEAIGSLAGGVAHDFNNLLTGIQGRVSLMAIDSNHAHTEHIKAIEEYIRSATNLTKQLLGVARGGKYDPKPSDLTEMVANSAAMFGRTKKEIAIHIKAPQSAVVVEVDKRQIEQVLLNIYVNAWQAMSNGGELYLETAVVELDAETCKPHNLNPGPYGKISVSDTGVGMDEATLQRIFDPFFTTKEKGRGTGLGLASAYGIIKNHHGMILVSSDLGHGSTFDIYLPASDKDVQQEISQEGLVIKGSETILLVDDEEMIVEVGRAMLEELGYQVITAQDGQAAIETLQRMEGKIDLVVLDMIMPKMDGGATFDRIRELWPMMRVVLSSGYAINGQATEIMNRGCNGFIQKPFNLSELSQKIRTVLERDER